MPAAKPRPIGTPQPAIVCVGSKPPVVLEIHGLSDPDKIHTASATANAGLSTRTGGKSTNLRLGSLRHRLAPRTSTVARPARGHWLAFREHPTTGHPEQLARRIRGHHEHTSQLLTRGRFPQHQAAGVAAAIGHLGRSGPFFIVPLPA